MQTSRVTVPLVVAALALTASNAPAAEIASGPYLQRLGADHVEVRVELASPSPVVVEYGEGETLALSAEDRAAKPFHAIVLNGLAPSTRYRYRVRAGDVKSDVGTFATAPRDGSDTPFAFAIYGDNRTDTAAHASVVRSLGMESFEFLVNSGDFVQQGGDPRLWRDFFAIETPLLRNKCMFGCIGNHELFNDDVAAAYGRYFGPGAEGSLWGTFRWGSARFFLLNAFQDWSGSGEREWLERELVSADNESGLHWRFAVIHHSPWSGGPHGANKRLLAAGIPALLVKHHVDLVIAGHDHIYERGEAEGLKYLISGGGGAPLYRDIHSEPSTRKIEASYHYVLANVSADVVKLTAKRVDGSIIERVGFGHGSWMGESSADLAIPNRPLAQPRSSSACGCRAVGTSVPADLGTVAGVFVVMLVAARRRSASPPG